MPTTPHIERHFTSSDTIRDIVIGMADGLTVPFALAAGLSGAVDAVHIIMTAGLAEVAAGSIAMGLGGYLAARSDAEHYDTERKREAEEILDKTDVEITETTTILQNYGLSPQQARSVVEELRKRPEAWIDFMMRFELGMEKPQRSRARTSAVTIACSYIAGGAIPLAPYILAPALHLTTRHALYWSVCVTLLALLVFGYVKGRFTGSTPIKSAFQTTMIGGIAAAAAFALARLIS